MVRHLGGIAGRICRVVRALHEQEGRGAHASQVHRVIRVQQEPEPWRQGRGLEDLVDLVLTDRLGEGVVALMALAASKTHPRFR